MSGNIKEYIKYIARGISPLYDNDGIVVLNQKCIRNQKISLEESRIHNIHKKSVSEDKILQNFDVLINSTGVGTLGRVAQVKNIKDKITVDSHITIVRPNLEKINGEFFGYCIKVQEDFIETLGTGATGQTELSRDAILDNVVIPHYSKENQQKIAKILSNYDDLIENNNKRIKILEEMAQKIYKEWFVNFNYPGHETATFKDTELGKIPSDWDVKTLNQCSKLFDNQRKPLSSLQRSNMKGVYPYYGAAKILDYINDYIFEGKYLLLAEDGSVITEEGYPVLQFVNGKFWANNHTHIIQGIKNISTEFLYLSLAKYSIIRCITGAAQPKINQENLNRIELIIPNDNILIRFNNLISPIFDEIFLIEQKQKILKQTRDLLLPRLMSSEIDIDKLEIV